jgi:hypothetical protein
MDDSTKLRIRVAELCGAKRYKRPWDGKVFLCAEPPSKLWEAVSDDVVIVNSDVPDYPNDLNAMHEAETAKIFYDGLTVTPNEKRWRYELELVCGTMGAMLHATAEQRCRAFVATMENSK